MNIVEEIRKAVAERDPAATHFDRYTIDKELGGGEQGVVFRVHNPVGRAFALKLHFAGMAGAPKAQVLVDFEREMGILVPMTHRNVVRVHTGGLATWGGTPRQWSVSEGFRCTGPLVGTDSLLFYIMDFVAGVELSDLFPELQHPRGATGLQPKSVSERRYLFEELIVQVATAMAYFHGQSVAHKDMKPRNILFSADDTTFVVVDFGFARHSRSPQENETLRNVEYQDLKSAQVGDYFKNDLGRFALMLLDVLPSLRSEYDENRYAGIEEVLKRAAHADLASRPRGVKELLNEVSHYFIGGGGWRFQLKLDECLTPSRFGTFDMKVRIPASGSVLLTREVRSIIDTPDFQRLRGVRQLGPTIFVFPGANHTRFEHSLGAYALSLRYIEKLLSLPAFKRTCEPLEESIKCFVLVALLHDIGHYPYSHWIEEIDTYPDGVRIRTHEERARDIVLNGAIGRIVSSAWGIEPETLCNVIAGERIVDGKLVLINSFIDSAIDLDKVDYLMRDGVHCGVNYGQGIDVERLLDSLYVNPDSNRICLTDKGRSALLSILTCRNIMYQEVYWHKTVRACDAMFKRFFYEFLARKKPSHTKIERNLSSSDDDFIVGLYEDCFTDRKLRKLRKLVAPFAFQPPGRCIYKPACIYYQGVTEPPAFRRFFEHVLRPDCKFEGLVEIGNRIARTLRASGHHVQDCDIIVEKTPVAAKSESYGLEGVKFWNTRRRVFVDCPSELNALDKYLGNNKQAYIFCDPAHYHLLRGLAVSGELGTILESVLV